jgi:hypothetical protein
MAPRKEGNTHGLPADVLKAAQAATSGATLARAFKMEGKRARDVARRIGFYASDAARTQAKYLDNGAPSFGKARNDIIAALAPVFLKSKVAKASK